MILFDGFQKFKSHSKFSLSHSFSHCSSHLLNILLLSFIVSRMTDVTIAAGNSVNQIKINFGIMCVLCLIHIHIFFILNHISHNRDDLAFFANKFNGCSLLLFFHFDFHFDSKPSLLLFHLLFANIFSSTSWSCNTLSLYSQNSIMLIVHGCVVLRKLLMFSSNFISFTPPPPPLSPCVCIDLHFAFIHLSFRFPFIGFIFSYKLSTSQGKSFKVVYFFVVSLCPIVYLRLRPCSVQMHQSIQQIK